MPVPEDEGFSATLIGCAAPAADMSIISPSAADELGGGGGTPAGSAAALSVANRPSGVLAMHSAASSAVTKRPRRSISPSVFACCSASSLVRGGAAASAARTAARPSGERATHSAASSAVAKQPRLTSLPPRLTRAWQCLDLPGLSRLTQKKPVLLSATSSVSPSACACCRASLLVSGTDAAAALFAAA
eukprot:scaffold97570_cov72-Phaeocystis_antarctica.AAC.2